MREIVAHRLLQRRERPPQDPGTQDRSYGQGNPDFGGGVAYFNDNMISGGPIPENARTTPTPRIPPEDSVPRGCSLQAMEPLREWVCKGADMTSPAELPEYEAALCQLEEDPPDICQHNANIREERWSHFSLEGVRFPAMTVCNSERRSFGFL